ncbi:LysM peptidoglycan-binding domain-containing protein [Aurantimonas sp. A3-2-R12]|uniref:LysM peptidoglycan-binding domain-containing protein n=1 Tax=Aurantimonas sp. A3-2-R12 TaxID=3114362 RepID=UPI002E18838A|nr:LysM peptidoglycan-binding domain-containing protein [Aurantimonas sp. A3-2-R12]
MQRKALGIVFLCLVLLVAIVLGYWDMLSSEKLRIAQTEDLPASEDVATRQDSASVSQSDPNRPSTSDAGETETANARATSSEQSPAPDEAARIVPDPTDTAPRPEVSAKVEAADATTAEKQPASPLESASSVPPTEGEATAGDRPLFDLLRVEPDGSTLIAGRSAPGSRVTLHAGATVVGEDTANEAGEFVIVLLEPLTPGEHAISLTAITPEGTATGSRETAIVSVPQPGRGEDVLAMVEAPDEASRLMTVPVSPPRQAAGADSTDVGTAAAGRSATAISQDEAPTSAPAAGSEKPIDTDAAFLSNTSQAGEKDKAPEPATSPRLRIEAVEVEGEQIFVAGSADAGTSVRIYLDNVLVAENRATADNRFLVTAERPVAVGDHLVRADQVTVDGNVTARAEVPFTRPEGQAVAAIAPPPANGAAAVSPSPGVAMADRSEAETRIAAASAPVVDSDSVEGRTAEPKKAAAEIPERSPPPDTKAAGSFQGDEATTNEPPVSPPEGTLPASQTQSAAPARQEANATPPTDRPSVNPPVQIGEPRSPTGPKTPEIGQEGARAEASAAPDATDTDSSPPLMASRTETKVSEPTIPLQPGSGTVGERPASAILQEQRSVVATESEVSAAALDVPINRQAPLATATGRVIIRKGDTLWRISRDTYGRGSRYTVIYFANGNRIRNPDLIYPGQVFRLPAAQDDAREADAEPAQRN